MEAEKRIWKMEGVVTAGKTYRFHSGRKKAVFCQRDKLTWSALPEEWLELLA